MFRSDKYTVAITNRVKERRLKSLNEIKLSSNLDRVFINIYKCKIIGHTDRVKVHVKGIHEGPIPTQPVPHKLEQVFVKHYAPNMGLPPKDGQICKAANLNNNNNNKLGRDICW